MFQRAPDKFLYQSESVTEIIVCRYMSLPSAERCYASTLSPPKKIDSYATELHSQLCFMHTGTTLSFRMS